MKIFIGINESELKSKKKKKIVIKIIEDNFKDKTFITFLTIFLFKTKLKFVYRYLFIQINLFLIKRIRRRKKTEREIVRLFTQLLNYIYSILNLSVRYTINIRVSS